MTHEATNIWEERNRLDKASRLADALEPVLREYALNESIADLADRLDDDGWHLASLRAECNRPSDNTKALVVSILRRRENARANVEKLLSEDSEVTV